MEIQWNVTKPNGSIMYGICKYEEDEGRPVWNLLSSYGFGDEKTMLAVSKRLNGDDWTNPNRIYRTAKLRIWD